MKIVCFGDSLTRGVSFLKGRLRILKENYPNYLQTLFTNHGDIVTIVNKGVFNDNSDLLLERLSKDVINEHPDYAIINIGGNDCNFRWDEVVKDPEGSYEPIVPLERYLENIKNMVSKVAEAEIIPVVLTLPPLDPVRYYRTIATQYSHTVSRWISTVGGIEHWHGMYNRSLNKLLDTLSTLKVDVRTAIKSEGNLRDLISDDGIHLTAEGYKVVSKELYSTLLCEMELKDPQTL